jgi:hypothetical protein
MELSEKGTASSERAQLSPTGASGETFASGGGGPVGARHAFEGLIVFGKAGLFRERSKASLKLHTGLAV